MVGDGILKNFRNTRTITGGVIDAADELKVELVPLLWSFATPSREVEQGAYDTLKSEFLDRLSGAGEIDGVVLDLHGAMVTEEIEDAEADLISQRARDCRFASYCRKHLIFTQTSLPTR